MPNKPSVIERLKLSWRYFNHGMPVNTQAKQSPVMFPDFRNDTPEWHITDMQTYVEEGFNLNSLIYSAIMYKSKASTAAPLRAYGGDPEHPELLKPSHPLAKLVARPNLHQSQAEFSMLNTAYWNIMGNVFIFMDRAKRGGIPVQKISLRPDRVYIVPGKDIIKGYLYVPEGKAMRDGIPILPEDMMHVKMPNPMDPLEGMGYGLSPLSAIAYSADVDNDITKFLKIFFQRGAITPYMMMFKDPLDDTTIQRIKNRWHEQYGSYENWSEVGVMTNGGEIKQLTMPFKDMGFETIDERNEGRILGPLGVPPILIGTRTGLLRSTYSNYEQARKAFWQDTFIPELNLFESEYQYYLHGEDGSFVKFDISEVPALQSNTTELIDSAYKLWTMGTPANTALSTVGLDIGEIPGGDVSYIPNSVIAAGASIAEPDTSNQGAVDAENDTRTDGAKMRPFPGKRSA